MRSDERKNGEFDGDAISELLRSLPKVDAPSNFDFGVRARIAKGRPARTAWFPASARIAAPLALALAAGGYLGVSYFYSPDERSVPAVAETVIPPASVETKRPEVLAPSIPYQPVSDERNVAVSSPMNRTEARTQGEPAAPRTRPEPLSGGSFDSAIRESRTITANNGPANNGIDPTGTEAGVKVPANQILSMLGISARFESTGWRVLSVGAMNPSIAASVKPGDIVESIDGQPLSGRTLFKDRFVGRSIAVRRDGKTLSFQLHR